MIRQLVMDVENMSSPDQMEYAIKMFNEDMQQYSEIFLRWVVKKILQKKKGIDTWLHII